MACELTIISIQNFLFGSTNLNCPDVPIPICPPGNYTLVPVIQNGCVISYNCVLLSSNIDPFIPGSVSFSGRAGTLFFPDFGLINTTCPILNNIDPFIPGSVSFSGRAGTLFFPDFGLINTTCPTISELSSFIPSALESSGRAGTLFFPDFDSKLCVI
jgi:hypothetical protein